MWYFEFNEYMRQWRVYRNIEEFYLEDKYEAVTLCGTLNRYELEKMDWDKLSRITIVDNEGRSFEKWNVCIHPSVQDDERTLKLFLTSYETGN